jgi:hypothetical protein
MKMDRELIRQQRETFEQLKRQDKQWFQLRLTMGYSAVVGLLGILVVSGVILLAHHQFPSFVVASAAAAFFVDVLGLMLAVWKITLNPGFHSRLRPVARARPNRTRNQPRKELREPLLLPSAEDSTALPVAAGSAASSQTAILDTPAAVKELEADSGGDALTRC